jgi:hypothetical protein
MATHRPAFDAPSRDLKKAGAVVGTTDRVYPIAGDTVTFDDVLVQGDLSGVLEYNGRRVEITAINTIIGLELGAAGPRGPVWKGVVARVIS